MRISRTGTSNRESEGLSASGGWLARAQARHPALPVTGGAWGHCERSEQAPISKCLGASEGEWRDEEGAPSHERRRDGEAAGFLNVKPHGPPHIINGFTFLEIVVVLFIIGLLLLLVYPKVQTLTENNLQTASRHLVGEIQYLYHVAMATRQVYRLSYDLRDNQYRVYVVDPHEGKILSVSDAKREGSLPRGVAFQDVITQRQGKVTEGEAFTHFFPVGLAEKTIIHLTDKDRRAMTLDLNPLTGRVKLYEGYIEIKQAVSHE